METVKHWVGEVKAKMKEADTTLQVLHVHVCCAHSRPQTQNEAERAALDALNTRTEHEKEREAVRLEAIAVE
jgi:hypothetical protein